MFSEEEILNVDTASTMSHYSQDNLPQKTLRIKPSLAPLWTAELHHMKSIREEAWLHWTSLHSKRLRFDPLAATEGQEAVMSKGKMGRKKKEEGRKQRGDSRGWRPLCWLRPGTGDGPPPGCRCWRPGAEEFCRTGAEEGETFRRDEFIHWQPEGRWHSWVNADHTFQGSIKKNTMKKKERNSFQNVASC